MSDQNPGTIKYKSNKKRLNIGLIIIFIIILYFVVYFCAFLFEDSSTLYEVVKGSTDSVFDDQYTALAIRSESVVTSDTSGYVNFFVGDKSSIYVGQQAYLIDKSGELSARLKAVTQSQAILNENDMEVISDYINEFKMGFDNDNYYETYHFKYQIDAEILDLINSGIFDNNSINAGSYAVFNSKYAGIAVHYVDGFESITTESLSASLFRRNNYIKTIIKSNDYVEQGDPIYKVITSENWYLVIQIDNPEDLKDINVVTIEFLKDGITVDGNFEVAAKNGKYYGIISLAKDMVRYASDRYLQISFTDDTETGLKIPKTAVTEKPYYVVPIEFITQGSNSSAESFAVISTVDGKDTFSNVTPTIVKKEDGYCYISIDEGILNAGDVIQKTDSTEKFTVGVTAPIKGVYIDSAGTPYFRYINILGENSDYYIVSMNLSGGVRLYDQVYINYEDAIKK